jgi:hypothetical protein
VVNTMLSLIKGRRFKLWEYRVSHGSLLVRSPAGPEFDTNIDIISVGVEYISIPCYLGEILSIAEPTQDESRDAERVLQRRLTPPLRAWIFECQTGRFMLVGVSLKVQEHHGDIFESPFS